MMRHRAFGLIVLALVLFVSLVALSSCSRIRHEDRVVAMGTAVAVGQLTYTAIESEWRETLESTNGQRIPKNRYLLINMSVVNNASEEKAAPLLQLEDAKGQVYPEISEGGGVPEWLGYLRLLQMKETRSGRLLFDVPQGAYRLRVSSGGDPENEQTALIEIPFQLGSEVQSGSTTPAFGDVGANPPLPAPATPAKK
jgi:hypothetical protein